MKLRSQPTRIMLVLSLSWLSVISSAVQLIAAPPPASKIRYIPPPQVGTPSGRPKGTAGRDNCPQVSKPLTALVPASQPQGQTQPQLFGLTTQQRPQFWFYVPYTQAASNIKAQFILRDRSGKNLYSQPVSLPQKPGIISISLPANIPPLALDTNYRWIFQTRCTQPQSSSLLDDPPVPVQVEGQIRRVTLSPDIIKQLAAAKEPQAKIAIYAVNGMWFDCLTMLAQLRQKNPTDKAIETDWQNLLQSINLNEIADTPIQNQ